MNPTFVTARARRAALVLALALLALLVPLSAPPAHAEEAALPTTCVTFQGLPLGASYGVGAVFADSGVGMRTFPFQWDNGQFTNNGSANVDNLGLAGGTGKEMNLNNINLAFGLGTAPATDLRLRFGEYGGNLNIRINGDFRNFGNMQNINGAVIGGVNVSVPVGGFGNDMGQLILTGNIQSFMVGGQEFYIDDVCITK